MRQIIEKGHDFRIIPENFESATIFEVTKVNEEDFEVELPKVKNEELKDYLKGSDVEIFGSSIDGLIFFESKITDSNGTNLKITIPKHYKSIQRREYSRVKFMGQIELEGQEGNIISVEDISAGGMRLYTKKPLELAKNYKLKIKLINNLTIDCYLHPIRIQEEKMNNENVFAISGCYCDIQSIDRVALVQYSFKILMETENKENER